LLGYRPLVYFWIAEYTDGSALPQFDPETGRENRFSEVYHRKLERFGWYPFTSELAQKIMKAGKLVVIPTRNLSYTVRLGNGRKLVAYRTNTIKLHTESGEVERGETVYVLGVDCGEILEINESGNVVN
jgi:hypothetical protein